MNGSHTIPNPVSGLSESPTTPKRHLGMSYSWNYLLRVRRLDKVVGLPFDLFGLDRGFYHVGSVFVCPVGSFDRGFIHTKGLLGLVQIRSNIALHPDTTPLHLTHLSNKSTMISCTTLATFQMIAIVQSTAVTLYRLLLPLPPLPR